jgi:hypothetical protein
MKGNTGVFPVTHTPAIHTLAVDEDASCTTVKQKRHAATQAVFSDISRTFDISFVPDLFEGMRDRPAYLETAWELFKEEMNLERLDRRTKLIIALAITTDEAGTYFIAALPHAFRLDALDQATYDKIMSTIRFFIAFERYLSGIMPALTPNTVKFVNSCLREEYRSYETTRAGQFALSREEHHGAVCGIGRMIIMLVVLSCVVGIYWLI